MKKQSESSPKRSIDLARRRLMTGAIGAGAAAGLGLVSVNAQAEAPVQASKPEAESKCYRETDHIRRYYESARF